MATIARSKSRVASRQKRGTHPKKQRSPSTRVHGEDGLENVVGAAAARDLAARRAATETDDVALVNAVARAAARSLAP